MQTRTSSLIEASANVVSGMVIAFLISQLAAHFEPEIQRYIWKGFEWKVSASSNMFMTILLTAVSMWRGYSWRRYFNKQIMRSYNEAAKKRV